ncbi:hypothetical protein, partial [Gordonia desulfuricans]|uniref:hypothetical protein n=1 Tax=Gordonia desulfuricans TaxID=89051 RepID=UPI001FD002DA
MSRFIDGECTATELTRSPLVGEEFGKAWATAGSGDIGKSASTQMIPTITTASTMIVSIAEALSCRRSTKTLRRYPGKSSGS